MFASFGIPDYFTFVLGTIAIVLLPGPNSMYCMYAAGSKGVKAGYQAALGIFLGDLALMVAAVLGAGTLLKTSASLFFIFKALGGLYLAYLGFNLLKSTYQSFRHANLTTENEDTDLTKNLLTKNLAKNVANSSAKHSTNNIEENTAPLGHQAQTISNKSENVFLKALTLSLSNPKAILFFLSFFIQFVDPNYTHPMSSFAILGFTLQVISMTYLSVLIFAGSGLAAFFKRRQKLAGTGNGLVGLLFIGFAINLWYSKV